MNSESTRSQPAQTSFSMDDFAKALEQHSYEFQRGQVVRGKVETHESDGAYVDIGGKSLAYVPAQEVSLRRITDLSVVLPLEEEMDFLIIREQDEDGQVTLSRRQLEEKRVWENVLEMQENKQSVQVRVTGVNKGGVTVNLQGLRGFIPRSHLSEREDLDALVGQNLTATFLEVNLDAKKLVLSQREAQRSVAISHLEIGQLVEGKIVGIKPFGVFVDLNGVTGLLHIKQVSQNFIESLPTLFQTGQIVKAMITNIDEGKNRISLSTRVLENYPGEMVEKMAEVMESAEARAARAQQQIMQ
ncbi:MAG: S1 RNA-binding domain-containing protein [Kastovskya adunca ATA6-11-RM4]|jgi:small subunit ribosomal protein S1|nr:S1 RNA-binding domain-containing protein [Kastovskya adunca ATA6-11-RM4]